MSAAGGARLRAAAIATAAVGVVVAGYLTFVHYADLQPVCAGGGGGCERVQSSEQSELAGLPVALIGLLNYVVIAIALLIDTDRTRTLAAALALVGFGFSAYLTYVELFVIHAICQWCLANAAIATVLAALMVAIFARQEPPG